MRISLTPLLLVNKGNAPYDATYNGNNYRQPKRNICNIFNHFNPHFSVCCSTVSLFDIEKIRWNVNSSR